MTSIRDRLCALVGPQGCGLSVLVALVVWAPVALAQTRSYHVESFDVLLQVRADGTVDVEETLRFRFDGAFNGIYRDIVTEYRNPLGLDYTLRLIPLGVTDGRGQSLRHETSTPGEDFRFKVWVPDAEDASRVVKIRYRVERALRFPGEQDGFPAHDELYWNVTGTRWTVPILSSSAIVELPGDVLEEPWVGAFIGIHGSQDRDVPIERPSTNVVHFASGRRLEPGENFSIVVGWPPGAVIRPTVADQARDLFADNWPLLTPLALLAVMIAVYRRVGRDPDIGRSVVVEYEPPGGFRPAELGTLIDESVDLRDIVATVIDLAVRGYLRIEEESEAGWFGSDTVTRFIKLRPADEELRSFEREIFNGLFASKDNVEIGDLKTKFYTRIGGIRDLLYGELTKQGLFRSRPDRVRIGWFFMAALALLACGALGLIFSKPAFLFAAPVAGLVVGAFAPFMPARTASGRATYLQTRGFEEFLGRTEAERLRQLDLPEAAFERYLPFAMAFGVADHWADLFKGLETPPPTWYVGPQTHFQPALFSGRMNAMSAALGSAMTSAPRSSSSGSSGFSSGGGFSGGGFGGGGGGAF